MAVALDALGTAFNSAGSGVTSFTTVSSPITVGSGANLVLHLSLQFDGNPGAFTACNWDAGGTPQAMTQVGTTQLDGSSGSATAIFGLIAPHSGALQLNVAWTNALNYVACLISFTGADQGSVATTFKNVVQGNPSSTATTNSPYPPSGATINSPIGDYCVLCSSSVASSFTLTNIIGTSLYLDNSFVLGQGVYTPGAGASTSIACSTASATSAACAYIGCDIAAVAALPPQVGITQGHIFTPKSGPNRDLTPTRAFPPAIPGPGFLAPQTGIQPGTIFTPRKRGGPTRGLRPTQAFPSAIVPPVPQTGGGSYFLAYVSRRLRIFGRPKRILPFAATTQALLAAGAAMATGRATIGGKAALLATGAAKATGQATIAGKAALAATGKALAAGRAAISGKVPLLAVGKAISTGRATAVGAAALNTVGKAAATARTTISGTAALTAVGKAAAFGRSALSTTANLLTVGKAITTGRAAISGTVPLLATGKAAATARATITTAIAQRAVGEAIATGRAGPISVAASISTRSPAAAEGRAAISGSVLLSARSIAVAEGRGSLQDFIALSARSSAVAQARASATGAVPLSARSPAVTQARAAIGGTTQLSARSAAVAQARATPSTSTSSVALSARSSAIAQGRASARGAATLTAVGKATASASARTPSTGPLTGAGSWLTYIGGVRRSWIVNTARYALIPETTVALTASSAAISSGRATLTVPAPPAQTGAGSYVRPYISRRLRSYNRPHHLLPALGIRVQLFANSAAKSFGRLTGPTSNAALSARSIAEAAGRNTPSGRTPLLATGKATASGLATAAPTFALFATTRAMATARATPTFAAAFAARSIAVTQGRPGISGILPLLATGKAMASARGLDTLFFRFFAVSMAMATARATPTFSARLTTISPAAAHAILKMARSFVQMAATSSTAATGRTTVSGVGNFISLLATGAAKAFSTAGLVMTTLLLPPAGGGKRWPLPGGKKKLVRPIWDRPPSAPVQEPVAKPPVIRLPDAPKPTLPFLKAAIVPEEIFGPKPVTQAASPKKPRKSGISIAERNFLLMVEALLDDEDEDDEET